MYFQITRILFKSVNSMKIGISSPSFALEPFAQTFEAIATEFTHWELLADINQLLPDIADEFKQLTRSYDINFSVHAPFNDLNLAALNPQLRELAIEYIKQTIKTAHDLDITLITLHPGHLSPSGMYNIEKVQAANLKSIHEISEFASDFPVTIALENMPMKHWTLGTTVEEILGMIKNTQLGICFDIGHAFIQNEVEGFLENIARINNVHIHDNNGRRDEHLILGKGAIDIPDIVNKLNNGFNGNIIIESNNLHEGLESRKYLEKLFKDLGIKD